MERDGSRDAISIDNNRLLRLLGKLIASRFPYPNDRVGNGYQELRGLLHQANRHFIRVTWRWGLQFAMWVIVPDSHLGALCGAVQRHCDELREHLQHRGCRDRLANSNIAVVVD